MSASESPGLRTIFGSPAPRLHAASGATDLPPKPDPVFAYRASLVLPIALPVDMMRVAGVESRRPSRIREASMRQLLFLTGFVCLATSALLAQDVMTVAGGPETHKVVLDNDQVRMLDVRIQPGQKVAMHSHPPIPSIT